MKQRKNSMVTPSTSRSTNTIIKIDNSKKLTQSPSPLSRKSVNTPEKSNTNEKSSNSPSPIPRKTINTPDKKITLDKEVLSKSPITPRESSKSPITTPRESTKLINEVVIPIIPSSTTTEFKLEEESNKDNDNANPISSGSNINVTCRFRPLNEKEKKLTNDLCVEFTSAQSIIIKSTSENNKYDFSFDRIFDYNCTQEDVYKFAARPIVDTLFNGINGTIFAYGQTSSGKTFTMMGVMEDDTNQGIIPRINKQVFSIINNSNKSEIEYTVSVSMIEIYMEKIKVKDFNYKDLLQPQNCNLNIREDKINGIYIEELLEKKVTKVEEVFEIMKMGTDNRAIGKTNMNENSSRSHSIFIMQIISKNFVDLTTKTGKLYLVDLAGSEKISKTGVSGLLLEEAKTINKSLTSLGMVIKSLTDEKSGHIPYRESKLTRILQDSLGGNAKTSLIITCSPSNFNEAETLSTIRFGIRAKKIKNKAKVNKILSLAELKLEVVRLEKVLELSKQRVTFLEEYISVNAITESNKIPKSENVVENESMMNEIKGLADVKTLEKFEELSTQISFEKDLQKVLTKKNIQLSLDLQEISERYNYLEDQHQILFSEYDLISEKIKDLEILVKEKDKKIEELKNYNSNKDNKIIQELLEKNINLEEQLSKKSLIDYPQKKEEELQPFHCQNNSMTINVIDNKSIIFNDTFCNNNMNALKTISPTTEKFPNLIMTENDFFKKLKSIAEKNYELKALFDSYPALFNKPLLVNESFQNYNLDEKRVFFITPSKENKGSLKIKKDKSHLTCIELNDSSRINLSKCHNDSEITRFTAKTCGNKKDIDRDKIMQEIQSSVDNKLSKLKVINNYKKDFEFHIFNTWNLRNFRTKFKFYQSNNPDTIKND